MDRLGLDDLWAHTSVERLRNVGYCQPERGPGEGSGESNGVYGGHGASESQQQFKN